MPPRRASRSRPLAALLLAACGMLAPPSAQPATRPDIADLSLEQLANLVVTSATRREQPLAQVAASVFVITAEDIRRSGARTLPEALRLAPNLTVARTDASNYAISARGFANILANRLLVMIDGRTVFSPLFSGVFWDAQDVMLEDIDRIEVIDGPAGTLWGTNAVHGVINVITRSAQDTQGTLLAAGGGNAQADFAARRGAMTDGGTAWRAFVRGYGSRESEFADGRGVGDAARRLHGGFRIDGGSARDRWTLQGDLSAADVDQADVTRDLASGNLLVRWQRDVDADSAFVVQAYYDRTEREHPGTFRATLDTVDVEGQASFRPAPGHALLLGAGYRYQRDRVTNSAAQAFLPAHRDLATLYAVVQDEIALREGLVLTAGLKAERNPYTGFEYLPTLRLRWQATPETTLWGAVSRAVRAPSRIDRDFFVPGAPPYAIVGNDSFAGETTNVIEGGARGHAGARVSWSVTAFHHDHDRLRSLEPGPGGALVLGNGIEGRSSGIEGWATWQAARHWRLALGGQALRQRLSPKPGAAAVGGVDALGNDPRHQWLLRSSHDLADRLELDFVARYVGERPNPHVDGYFAADARLGWRVTRDVAVALTLSNLTDSRHPEWGPAAQPAQYRRAWFLAVTAALR